MGTQNKSFECTQFKGRRGVVPTTTTREQGGMGNEQSSRLEWKIRRGSSSSLRMVYKINQSAQKCTEQQVSMI